MPSYSLGGALHLYCQLGTLEPKDTISVCPEASYLSWVVKELVRVDRLDRWPAGRAVGNVSSCVLIADLLEEVPSDPARLPDLLHWACQPRLPALLSPLNLTSPSHEGPGRLLHGCSFSATPPLTSLYLASCHLGLSVCLIQLSAAKAQNSVRQFSVTECSASFQAPVGSVVIPWGKPNKFTPSSAGVWRQL